MKIMWLCNVPIVKICEALEMDAPVVGGWLNGASRYILEGDNTLIYLFPYKERVEGKIDNLIYVGYVEKNTYNYDNDNENYFKAVIEKFKPDIVHIWGTEFIHSLEMVNAALEIGLSDKLIVSIQGLISECAKVYTLGIKKDALKRKTLRDIIRKDNLIKQKANFEKRGENEKEIIEKVNHVIGRTSWDKRICRAINHNVNYHVCNESLRQGFYTADEWNYDACRKHSIFCSQGNYPIKGFHIAIEAFAVLKQKYPDLEVRVTGEDYVNQSFLKRQKKPYYYTYLRDLIVKNGLVSSIKFLGSLDTEKMIQEYQQANVFLSPSLMENSSNSIGEAMMIGTPVVSSDVGGCDSIIDNGRTGILYDVTNVSALARSVDNLFSDIETAKKFSEEERMVAFKRHDGKKNNDTLIAIYNSLQKRCL